MSCSCLEKYPGNKLKQEQEVELCNKNNFEKRKKKFFFNFWKLILPPSSFFKQFSEPPPGWISF